MRIKLKDILDLIDYNRESQTSKIQICHCDGDWDEYDEADTCSCLLLPLYGAEVKEMGAVGVDKIRVDIDWEKLNKETGLFNWQFNDDEEEKKEE